MKRLKQHRPLFGFMTPTLLVMVVAFTNHVSAQEEKPAQTTQQKDGKTIAEDKPEEQPAEMLTCPMHPQIHQAEGGRCPICAMQLVARKHEDADSLMSLDRMLSLALQHNPDIRVERANVISAEAELDRARLTVVQKVLVYRERWKAQQSAVTVSAQELEQAQQLGNEGVISKQLANNARRSLAIERARLSEIEAELPFLLGQRYVGEVHAAADSKAAAVQDRLIPMIEQLIKVMVEDSRSGNAKLTDVQPWSRRLAELKVRIAATKAERIAAVQSYVELQESIAEMTRARYRTGEISQAEVLAANVHLTEAELWLTEVGDSSR